MKRLILGIIALVALGVAYWLISPLWQTETLNEELPGLNKAMSNMSAQEQADFNSQMDAMRDVVMDKSESMVWEPNILGTATLVAEAHEVEGRVLLVESEGKTYLRFENLDTVNGPDLRIYLSSDLGVSDAIDLGPIRATRGNVNYELPPGTDLDKYKNALIWCRAFSVLFSYGQF